MNPSKTLSCYDQQFPKMVADEKKAILKLIITKKGVRKVEEDKSVERTDGKRRRFETKPQKGESCRMDKIGSKRAMSVKERLKSKLRLMQAKPRKACSSIHKTANKGNSSPTSVTDFSCLSGTTHSHCLQTSATDVLNHEKTPTPASFQGWSFDGNMSPKKALRVAMLKRRFAGTIFKATHTLLYDSEKSGLTRMKEERQRLEKEAWTEAVTKSAEAALRRQEQTDRIVEDRKAARMELEKMERSVGLDNNAIAWKDLELLLGFSDRSGYPDRRPLARLGLHRKDDC